MRDAPVQFGVLLPTREAVKAMLCIAGSWDEVIDRLEAFREAGARTMVLRFAARDQLDQLEKCAAALHRRRLLTDNSART